MPKSKVRKKTDYTASASRTPLKVRSSSGWAYKAVMFGFMVVGLVWLIVYYLGATGQYGQDGGPLAWMSALGPWNFLIGFGAAVVGLLMTMGWR